MVKCTVTVIAFIPVPACAGTGSSGNSALGPRFRGDERKTLKPGHDGLALFW